MESLYPASFMSSSNWLMSTEWTKEENKAFESALAMFDQESPDRWVHIAQMIPGKTVWDVMKKYEELIDDVKDIEEGRVPIPVYLASSFTLELVDNRNFDAYRKRSSRAGGTDQERKKGVPWTEEEHRRFLMGLLKYGKGDWRNISRNYVISKTPTQVASHAQKPEIRLQNGLIEQEDPLNPSEGSAKSDNALSSSAENEDVYHSQANNDPDNLSVKGQDLILQHKDDPLNPGEGSPKADNALSTSAKNEEVYQSWANNDPDNLSVKGQDLISQHKDDPLNPDEGSAKADNALSTSAEDEDVYQSGANNDPDNLSVKGQDLISQHKDDKQTSSETLDNLLTVKPKEQENGQEDEPDWKKMFLNGLEEREKMLLTEYTTTLRSYKVVKKKLSEVEKKSQDNSFDTSMQLKELKSSNAMKDEEIKSLRQKVNLLLKCLDENKDSEDSKASDFPQKANFLDDLSFDPKAGTGLTTLVREKDNFKLTLVDQPPETMSAIEEKLRMNIDELLEENLGFWLKFSTSFHQIQKFETGIQDLQAEILKLEEKGKKLEAGSARYSLKSDARPIYKHMREIQTELILWLEQCALLKDELHCRFSSLCNIQEEITTALKESAEEDEFKFTSYQAAKFQGEVLNMKQENNRVGDELQAGLDHVTTLQLELERTLAKLNEEFGLAGSRKQSNPLLRHTENSRNRVPLRSFIFGVKQKKQKPSIFSCMTPAMNKKYPGMRAEHNV